MAINRRHQEITGKTETVVIAVAGASGSGKSTLVRALAQRIENAEAMYFDDYHPNYGNLTKDLQDLRRGNHVTYPEDDRRIDAGKVIILEEPTGRTRRGMRDKIDFLVYVNLPLEVSLARVLLRSIKQSEDRDINGFYEAIGPQFEPKFSEEKPTKLMHIMVWQLEMYLKQHRQGYLVDHEANLKDADLVVDGLKSVNQLIMEITEKVITRFNLDITSNMN
jgi:pantothenate kinase